MKKSTKIILPALAVLVLGTAAAATGTVAWFAANGVVEAKGMQVQCATSKNLMIANEATIGADTDYGTEASSINVDALTLKPSSTTKELIASGTPKFFIADSTVDVSDGTLKPGAVISEGVANTAYAKHSFWLAASSPSDLELKIKSIEVKDATGADVNSYISQALRFGVYYVDTTRSETKSTDTVYSNIFRLGSGADTYYGLNKAGTVTSVGFDGSTVNEVKIGETKDGEGNLTGGESIVSEVTPGSRASIANYSLGMLEATTTGASIAGHTWTEIDFYFWYEGQDPACTAANALSVQDLQISVKIEANIA